MERKIINTRTDILNYDVKPEQLSEGEILVNYNENNPKIQFKDTSNKIVEIVTKDYIDGQVGKPISENDIMEIFQ